MIYGVREEAPWLLLPLVLLLRFSWLLREEEELAVAQGGDGGGTARDAEMMEAGCAEQ